MLSCIFGQNKNVIKIQILIRVKVWNGTPSSLFHNSLNELHYINHFKPEEWDAENM